MQRDYKQIYEKIKEIGSGGFGKVYKVKVKGGDVYRAMKIINKNLIRRALREEYIKQNVELELSSFNKDFRDEIKYMQICEANNNKNSVKFYEYFDTEDEFVIIMELCDENMTNLIQRKKKLNLEEIYDFLSQLNNTFKIMYENKITHRDLKLENILIVYEDKEKTKCIYKLTDYGISREYLTFSQRFSSYVGTPTLMAPEILDKQNYGYECDMWSLGIIIYILFFGKSPYNAQTEEGILKQITNFGQKILLKSGDNDFDKLIKELLVSNPKNRIVWKDYFIHSFFTKRQTSNNNINNNKNNNINNYKNNNINNKINNNKNNNINNNINNSINNKYKNNNINNKDNNISNNNFHNNTINNKNNTNKLINNFIKNSDVNKINNITINKKQKLPNEINIIVNVGEIDKNEDKFRNIYFMENNSYREENEQQNNDINNLNDKNTEIFIDDKKMKLFNKYFIPTKVGLHKIKIKFKNKIKDCSYMFRGCGNIISIDFSSFDSSEVISMKQMFSICYGLQEVNLNNLNVKNVKDMSYMFNKCMEIKKIIIPSSFDTQNVENMDFIFHFCQILEDINFSPSFKTNNVKSMKGIFGKCYKLKKLDLRNFNTGEVKDMSFMFDQCKDLEEILINPSTFRTNKAKNMGHMFNDCNNLKGFDLSGFNTGNVEFFTYMFYDCQRLDNLDLTKLVISNNANKAYMFEGCPKYDKN